MADPHNHPSPSFNAKSLFTYWREGWKGTLDKSLEDWNKRQTQATVRNNPAIAIEQLEGMGYEISRREQSLDP